LNSQNGGGSAVGARLDVVVGMERKIDVSIDRTLNIQHSTPNIEGWREAERLGGSKLGVKC
jgi:hypothetical protein